MAPSFLLYGAYGYTGNLIARSAVQRGMRPVLAGRNQQKVRAQAEKLGLEYRAFHLADPIAVDAGLAGSRVMLNCAGPFSHTARPMAEGCLRAGAHYLDVTGEMEVFEDLALLGTEAGAAGVMLLPGVGFDVVPSDCLAAHLKRMLPSADHLALAFQSLGTPSRGTMATALERLSRGGVLRQNGRLVPVPAAWKARDIDFGKGSVRAVAIPWGDLVTAFHSTGIPNIEVYSTLPAAFRWSALLARPLGPLLSSPAVRHLLSLWIRTRPPGPSDSELATGSSVLWGEVRDPAGRRAVARLRGPQAYEFTARTALAVVERVLAGRVLPGFQTPSMAYGPDFPLDIQGVVREDLS